MPIKLNRYFINKKLAFSICENILLQLRNKKNCWGMNKDIILNQEYLKTSTLNKGIRKNWETIPNKKKELRKLFFSCYLNMYKSSSFSSKFNKKV
jgi:hypothetical protein